MKTFTASHLIKLIRDGRVEFISETNSFSRAEIRWIRTGKRETINVK